MYVERKMTAVYYLEILENKVHKFPEIYRLNVKEMKDINFLCKN